MMLINVYPCLHFTKSSIVILCISIKYNTFFTINSLILGFIWLIKLQNKQSILLFDEIASHIDGKNLELFFNEIQKIGMQTWYTGTNEQLFQAIENKAFFVKL